MRRPALVLLALVVAFAATAARAAEVPDRETLARQFQTIAFSAEFGESGRRGHLVKWIEPIRIALAGIDRRYYPLINERILLLTELSGQLIGYADPPGEANLRIRFVSREQVRRVSGQDAPCATRAITRGGVIVHAQILIAPESDDLIAHCLSEEMTQALGLLDDSDLIPDSIFHDATTRPDLLPADELMVRILYDRRLPPGLSEAEAMPTVRQIISEWVR